MKLSRKHQRLSVEAVRLMRVKTKLPVRLRNFIRLNFGIEYSLSSARRIWTKYRHARIGG
jgi:hypothetical protein